MVLFLIPYAASNYISRNKTTSEAPASNTNIQETSAPSPSVPVSTGESSSSPDPESRVLDYVQHRRQLSPSDLVAKKKIISLLSSTDHSGDLYHSSNINIDYTASVDLFQVEILTTSVDSAEQEAVNYFTQEGMSQTGICNLPVSFYLNFDVKNAIPTDTPFSPLAPGC